MWLGEVSFWFNRKGNHSPDTSFALSFTYLRVTCKCFPFDILYYKVTKFPWSQGIIFYPKLTCGDFDARGSISLSFDPTKISVSLQIFFRGRTSKTLFLSSEISWFAVIYSLSLGEIRPLKSCKSLNEKLLDSCWEQRTQEFCFGKKDFFFIQNHREMRTINKDFLNFWGFHGAIKIVS